MERQREKNKADINKRNVAFLALDAHPGADDEPLSQNGYNFREK